MNNRGQSILMGVVVGLFLFMGGMLALNFIDEATWNDGTGSLETQLGCDNSAISDGDKLTCLIGEIIVPYFIIIVISTAGGIMTERFLA